MRVIDFAPPPTTPPDFGDTRQLARAGTQAAVENAPGASVAAAVRDSQRIGMAILPALRAGDYAGAAAAIVQSAAAAVLGAVPGAHTLPAFAGIIKAYHGSPHTFDEFKLEKVGTGEGAQAYGHGLYFAEKPEVAADYQRRLAGGPDVFYEGKKINDITKPGDLADHLGVDVDTAEALTFVPNRGSVEEAAADMRAQAAMRRDKGEFQAAKHWDNRAKTIDANKDKLTFGQRSGALYHVDLDVKPEELLDWDKPLSQQAPGVAEKLKGFNLDYMRPEDTGATAYNKIAYQMEKQGHTDPSGKLGRSEAAASAALRSAGIPGIKYLDQGSRAAGDGTSNFVIFDPSVIAMVSRNGQPLVSSADKASDGLAVLAHPAAWQPGGAK